MINSQSRTPSSSQSKDIISKNSDYSIQSLSTLLLPECTASTFGHVKIKQEGYTCVFCSTSKRLRLCTYCYENCHLKCREGQPFQYKRMYCKKKTRLDVSKEFACDCGLLLKHLITPKPKEEFSPCQLSLVDQQFIPNQFFYCEEDKMKICSMCYFICHKNCSNKRKYNSEKSVSDDRSFTSCHSSLEGYECLCKYNNHTVYNEFTFQIPIFDYQSEIESSFWPIQLINTLFNTGTIFSQLKSKFHTVMNEVQENKSNYLIFGKDNPFPYLLEQFSNMFNRKFKTYYYHPQIEMMFPLEGLINLIKAITPKNQKMILVKFRLLFILLFVHLKKDFSFFKSLTSSDFITNNLLERLKIKKLISQNNCFTQKIHEKYNFQQNILTEFALNDFIPFMEIGFQNNLLNILEFQDELEIGLQYLAFLLKRMLFSRKQLEMLIKQIYPVHDKFILGINLQDDTIFQSWVDIFKAFCEVFFVISVNYNDLLVEEYLEQNYCNSKFNEDYFDNIHFIHTQSEFGGLLLKMITKNCLVLSKHYEMKSFSAGDSFLNEPLIDNILTEVSVTRKSIDDIKKRINPNGVLTKMPKSGILFEKVIDIFNESLNIFSLTDNSYYHQIKSITYDDIKQYYSYKNELKKYEVNSKNKTSNKTIDQNPLYDIKLKLEKELSEMFMKIFDLEAISKKNESSPFEKITQKYFDWLKNQQINEKYSQDTSTEKNIYLNNVINYYIRPFVPKINNFKTIPSFISEITNDMIISNIEDTITNIFVLLSNRRFPKTLTLNFFRQGLSILSFFFFIKRRNK